MSEIGSVTKERNLRLDCVPKGIEDYLSFSIVLGKGNRKKRAVGGRGGGGAKRSRGSEFIDDMAAGSDESDGEEEIDYDREETLEDLIGDADAGDSWDIEETFGATHYRLKFIDTIQFMNSSLDALVKNCETLPLTESVYTQQYKMDLLKRKCVYPYDYMDSFDRFEEDHLPTRESFYNKLSEEECSPENYAHAQNVWKTFDCKTLGDYHDLYVTTDTLFLADVFERFRNFCIENYGLDPAHYISLPSFAWDSFLAMTGVKLELIKDQEMFEFVESGQRGGIAMIAHRYAKANHELLEDFDPNEPKEWLMYWDANNLYG